MIKITKTYSLFFVAALFVAVAFPSAVMASGQWAGTVMYVSDGDTLVVRPDDGGEKVKVRVAMVDCPEKDQPSGLEAKEFAKGFLETSRVTISPVATDRYGRTVAMVFREQDGKSLQEALIANGWAWVYRDYCKDKVLCPAFQSLEFIAKARRLGLWSEPGPIPPWEWRHSRQ